MRVKCRRDGEFARRTKGQSLAVHGSHPAVLLLSSIFRYSFTNKRTTVAKEVFFMLSKREKGLRNVRVLVFSAMLAAISVVIGIFCKNFLNFGNGLFRVTFEKHFKEIPLLVALTGWSGG